MSKSHLITPEIKQGRTVQPTIGFLSQPNQLVVRISPKMSGKFTIFFMYVPAVGVVFSVAQNQFFLTEGGWNCRRDRGEYLKAFDHHDAGPPARVWQRLFFSRFSQGLAVSGGNGLEVEHAGTDCSRRKKKLGKITW